MRERNQRQSFALRDGVGFAGNVPIAVGRVEIAPLLAAEVGFGVRAGAAMVHLIGPHVLLEILCGIEHRAGFEQGDVDAEIGENFDCRAASGAGADDHDVENLGSACNLEHGVHSTAEYNRRVWNQSIAAEFCVA